MESWSSTSHAYISKKIVKKIKGGTNAQSTYPTSYYKTKQKEGLIFTLLFYCAYDSGLLVIFLRVCYDNEILCCSF